MNLKKLSVWKNSKFLTVGGMFAVVGSVLLISTSAAVLINAIEPEDGVGAQIVTDVSASAGKAILFARANSPTPTQSTTPGTGNAYSDQFGYRWKPVRMGGGGNVSGIDAADDGTLVTRIDVYGGYIMEPGSNMWRQLVTRDSMPANWRQPKASQGLFEVAIAPSDSNRIYIQYMGHVFRSNDKGKTFTQTAYTPLPWDANGGYGRGHGNKMAVDPTNPDVVFAGAPKGAMRVSYDGGATWKETTVPAGQYEQKTDDLGGNPDNTVKSVGITGIAFDRSSGTVNGRTKVAYAASWKNGVYRTADGGDTWTSIGGSDKIIHAGVDAAGVYYTISAYDIFWNAGFQQMTVQKYANGSWTNITTAAINDEYGGIGSVENPFLAVHPTAPGRVVVGHAKRIYQSNDSGATWNRIGYVDKSSDVAWQKIDTSGFGYLVASDIIFSKANPDELWMSVGHGTQKALLTPTSTSMQFERIAKGMETMVATRSVSTTAGQNFAMFDFGIFSGSTNLDDWSLVKGPIENFSGTTSIAVSPFDRNHVAHVTTSYVGGEPPTDAGYSTNGGVSWTRYPRMPIGTGNSADFGYGATAISGIGNMIWAPGHYFGNGPASAQPYYTKDSGSSWSPVNLPGVSSYPRDSISGSMFGRNRQTITADTVNQGTFYLHMVGQGVFRTTDGGSSWTKVYSSSASISGGTFGQDTWTSANLQAMPGQAGALFYTDGSQGGHNYTGPAANEGTPFMRSNDGGASWSAVPNVERVFTFGFGKAAPGSSHATIYIVGHVGGTYGVWRSTDNAASWTQIADYPYVLDLPLTINGDMNIYGRVYVGMFGSSYVYGDIL